jgi:hypothetical protein
LSICVGHAAGSVPHIFCSAATFARLTKSPHSGSGSPAAEVLATVPFRNNRHYDCFFAAVVGRPIF